MDFFFFEKQFFMKKVFENQLHKRGPTGLPICLPVFSANYGLVLLITSETEPEILGACCAKVLIGKRFEKGPRNAFRLLREHDRF
jgi:hypothetical protein